MKTFHLRERRAFQSLSFLTHGSAVVSVFVPVSCRREFLWWWLSEALIYGHNKILLKVILLLCSVSRTTVFGFPLGAWPI